MLQHPASLVSLSDAGAHLTFFNDAGFGLHLLGHWVRDLNVLSLPEAVRRLTRQPADLYGLDGRGRIAVGGCADLMLFDPATVGRGPAYRARDLPAGGARLMTDPLGVHGVWVAGRRIVDDAGRMMPLEGPLPGRLLRHQSG
ncbi:MAG: amidohydrolase family protein [Burkholderiaceae bacterium]